MKKQYELNKSANVGDKCVCPSCSTEFTKDNYQQAFCKSKQGTKCKDKYWNTVTPNKRNNTTRISPASSRWLAKQENKREREFNPDDYEHPFSSDALGQW
jgi:hypothetical protein